MHPPFWRSFNTANNLVFGGRRLRIGYRKHPPAPPGQEVHASSFLSEGRILLDASLRRNVPERHRILTHEVFHFVWRRLGNPKRASWRALLAAEIKAKARGELGWSAEWRKKILTLADIAGESRCWRDYACESFCDTAAYLYGGLKRHEEFTLAKKWRNLRAAWFVEYIEGRELRL